MGKFIHVKGGLESGQHVKDFFLYISICIYSCILIRYLSLCTEQELIPIMPRTRSSANNVYDSIISETMMCLVKD